MRHWFKVILLILLILLVGCSVMPELHPKKPDLEWVYADLRMLDAADGPTPSQDLVAIYVRKNGSEFQIRLDMLDLTSDLDYDLYLAMDTSLGGEVSLPLETIAGLKPDLLLSIPASGALQAVIGSGNPLPQARLRVVRDPELDVVVVSFNRAAIPVQPGGFQVQVFVAPAGSSTAADRIGPVWLESVSLSKPVGRVELGILFWDTFSAYTPAQALKRWDGAHSGPDSGRHGLKHLLNALQAERFPAVLLDLGNPESLSALEYFGASDLLRRLSDKGLVVLPQNLPVVFSPWTFFHPGWIVEEALRFDREISSEMGYTPLGIGYSLAVNGGGWLGVFGCGGGILSGGGNGYTQVFNYQFDFSPASQVDVPNPPLGLRRSLVTSALHSDQELFFLGGPLSASRWGAPGVAVKTLHWLTYHPWIRMMDGRQLHRTLQTPLALPVDVDPETGSMQQIIRLSTANIQMLNQLEAAFANTPENQLKQTAWQAFLPLLAPGSPAEMGLRSNYLGQIGHLLEAARWLEERYARADCSADLDWDGVPECVLASEQTFAAIRTTGGMVTFAFTISATGVHQLIGPTSQLHAGLGDPMDWDLALGFAADPNQVPGAFYDTAHPWQEYWAVATPGKVTLTSPDGMPVKVVSLVSGGLRMDGVTNELVTTRIPLVLDPWLRFSSGWSAFYQEAAHPEGWQWGLPGDFNVLLRTSGNLFTQTFTQSRDLLGLPEDPNHEYPPGHYLPFPLALAEIILQNNFWIELVSYP